MSAEARAQRCAFDILFKGNFPHILEEIFFSLDYTSYKTCPQVSKSWRDLFRSQPFQIFQNSKLKEMRANEQVLLNAAKSGNFEKVRQLLLNGVYFSPRNIGNILLQYAARFGKLEMIMIALKKRVDLNKLRLHGKPPLLWAAYTTDWQIIDVFCNYF